MGLIILFFSLLTMNTYATIDANTFCGGTHAENKILAPFSQTGKHLWCMTANCILDDGVSERSKCINHSNDKNEKGKPVYHSNSVLVTIDDHVKGKNFSALRSRGHAHTLSRGTECFNECRPEEVKGFFGKKSVKFGLEKEACAKCVINLPATAPESYIVEGQGVRVYTGQKCYFLCKIPRGDYSEESRYSAECLSCVGAQGLKPIEHMTNKDGQCFEFNEMNNKEYASLIPDKICKDKGVDYGTYFKKSSAYTLGTLFFKEPIKCLEVDEKTGGTLYKRSVPMIHCEPNPAVSNKDRGLIKDTPTSPSNPKTKSSGAKRN